MADDYDDLAEHYHWLFDEGMLSGNWFVDRHRPLLQGLPPGASVLDCACGTGNVALALARQGYDVQGSDGSAGMVAQARKQARQDGQAVTFRVCSWENLPAVFPARFDLVHDQGSCWGMPRWRPVAQPVF